MDVHQRERVEMQRAQAFGGVVCVPVSILGLLGAFALFIWNKSRP